jgi:hypothetical protein
VIGNFSGLKRHPKIVLDGVTVELEFLDIWDEIELTNSAFQEAANELGCELAAIKAVAKTETKASPYYRKNKDWDWVPTILYERHWFKKLTNGNYNASHPEISGAMYYRRTAQNLQTYPATDLYPDSIEGSFKRFMAAYALNKDAAIQACSWGQLNFIKGGFNMKLLRYWTRNVLCFISILLLNCAAIVRADENRYTNHGQFNSTTLCHIGESVYFSCKTGKGKFISLCGAKTENRNPNLYYRFGKQDNIEMEYPNTLNQKSLAKFSYIRRSRMQLDDVSVLFQQEGYEYRLYSYYNAEDFGKAADIGHGIFVGKVNSKTPKNPSVNIKCTDNLIDRLMLTTYFLPCNENQEYSCTAEFDEYGKPISKNEKARE